MANPNKKPEQFRLDTAYGKLYEWDEEQQAYLFCLSTDANYLEDAIKEYYNDGTIEELYGFGN